MEIIRVTEEFKNHWDNFVINHAADGGLLQSWYWGELQKSLGNQIFRLGLIDSFGQLQAAALLIKHEIHFEYNYLYCPRGPVINVLQVNDLDSLLAEIKLISQEEKSFLLRVDPAWVMGHEKLLTTKGFRKGEKEVQPKCSFILDLEHSENDLLSAMKQKTRYNINVALKHGVKIIISSEISDIEMFWQLTKQTSERDGFKPHAKEHYKKMCEQMCPSGVMKIFMAEYNGKVIAANLMAFFGNCATYLHGSSSDINRGVMAPYLLQWQAILEAKKMGLKYYDFGGVNGTTYQNDKWEGISRFKTGFDQNALPKEFIGSYELVFNPVTYSVYKFVKAIRG